MDRSNRGGVMKKLLLGLLVFSCFFLQTTEGYTDWDSSTDMQTKTVSAGFTQIQNNAKAIDGSSGTAPDTYFAVSGYDVTGAADLDIGSADVLDITITENDSTLIIDGGITVSTGDKIQIGTTQWNSGDEIDGTKVKDADLGEITVSAGGVWSVDNLTTTTALTVDTGTVGLTGNAANSSVLTLGAGASSIVGANTGDQTTITGNAGSATILETTRAIYGNNFDGSAPLTQVIASTYGGTGNGFTKFTGPTTAEKTFTLPDANATLLYSGGALGTPSGGTLTSCTGLPYTGLANGTDGNLITWAADATIAVVATGDAGQVLTSGGVGVAPTFQAAAAAASTALDNLASVAINLGLLPGTTDSIDLGSTAKLWQAIYVSTANISRMFTHIVYVGTGSAFTTIDSALNVVVPGDTILVESSPTAYDEAITFDDDNITLKAIGSKENTTITQANATIVNFGVKSNCVLDGFTIDMLAATTSERRCITGANDGVTASTKNIIRNCDITYTSSADIINRPVNFTNGYWKIENCNITLTTTATSPNTTYALQTTNSDGIELVHTKIKVYADSATGTPVIACWVNAATTILDEMRDCELYLSSSAITAGALYAFIANATTTNIYNSKLTVICSSTANVKTITNGSGQTINSYGNIYTATNSDNDGKWASIASGATLNSYGDSIIDGSLSNAGTANIYSTTTEGDLYVFGEMSAQSIDDRASKFGGDALADVMKVKDIAGNIDPTTLPQHIQIPRSKEVWNKDLKKTKTEVISIGKNLGDMVLMNMRAIQQLEEKIKDLKKDAD